MFTILCLTILLSFGIVLRGHLTKIEQICFLALLAGKSLMH